MKAKWLFVIAGAVVLTGVSVYSQGADKAAPSPATSPAAVPGVQVPAARGKGTLVELPVPAAAAFKTEDGRSGWKVKIPGGRPLATPALADGVLFVGGGFGSYEFYALDAETGRRRWSFRCGDDGPTAAVAADGCVAYNTESCTIYIHDLRTGKVLWHKWLGDPLMSQPAIGGGKVLMAYPGKGGHRLAAFELRTGKVAWEKPIAAEVITAPVIAGDVAVAATVDGTLYRFDLATGRQSWAKKCNVTSAPRVVGRQVLISQRSQKQITLKDEKGNEKTSKVTVEGLNIVDLADGEIAHAEPLSPVEAAFLLALGAQGTTFAENNAVSIAGQNAYRLTLNSGRVTLGRINGKRGAKARQLAERIERFENRNASDKPAEGRKDAEAALNLAADLENLANGKADNAEEKQANEQLKKLAKDIRDTAEKTKEAAGAAGQAEQTISATKGQLKEDKAHDANVGFSTAPAAAKLELAQGNIGQVSVKAVWAYQGSRPCIHEGRSIMVHGPTMRAVEIATGNVAWEHRFDFKASATRPVTPPALAGGKLYVGTVDGRIICADARTGRTLWQSKVGGRILFEPSVAGGCVYAATADGTLICLRTGDETADGWHMWGGSADHNGGK
jgi:outer membrane protein assembly factor BamB